MDIMDNFTSDLWERADASKDQGYRLFRVVRYLPDASDKDAQVHVYALFDDQGDLRRVEFTGATCASPLIGVSNINLKLSHHAIGDCLSHTNVTGILLEDDCIELRSAHVK